jgi:hypothetical protein
MNAADYAVMFTVIAIVVIAVILLIAHFIRADYQLTGSFRISRRNPPRPPRSPAGAVPPPAGSTEATS